MATSGGPTVEDCLRALELFGEAIADAQQRSAAALQAAGATVELLRRLIEEERRGQKA